MLNFLLPSGSVELIITTWDGRQKYKQSRVKGVECPDYDRGIHNSIAHVETVGYCLIDGPGSDGWSEITLEKEKFMEKFEFAKSIIENNFSFSRNGAA